MSTGRAAADEGAAHPRPGRRRAARGRLDLARPRRAVARRSACRCSPLRCCRSPSATPSIRDLKVDVVDADRTQTSMIFVQAVNAAPGVTVTRRSTDLNGAMHAIRSGEAIAAVYIPRDLERDIVGGQAAADRDLLQQAVLHAGQHRLERAVSGAVGRGRRPAATSAGSAPAIAPGRWSSSNMC